MDNAKSPLTCLPRLGRQLSISLRVKRDDLFPMTGGGNKARKMLWILEDVERQQCDALVTTGGLQSNHARVTALVAAARGWPSKLVLHGEPQNASQAKGNLLLMRLTGAEIQLVEPSGIAGAMRSAMNALRSDGYAPYEIPGGGHCVAGTMAYASAVSELHEQCRKDAWQPDWLILASGTGTTQAGLVVGLERLGWSTRVVGISVARRNPRGERICREACHALRTTLGMRSRSGTIDFRDHWVGEGYEQAGESVLAAIRLAAETDGLVLDPTYTGKAFAGLLELVGEGEIEKGSNVLFWHTGGLLNLMASDYLTEVLSS